MDPFIGEIRLLPYTYAPAGWALCNGQLLPISMNTALYSIIGTAYGGDGKTSFALPDLQGRVAPGAGQGPGLSSWPLGETGGENGVALTELEMPQHNHTLSGLDAAGDTGVPSAGAYLGRDQRGGQGVINYLVSSNEPHNTPMALQTLGVSGSNQAHENRQPFLAMNFCIALEGIYPSRS